MTIKNGAAEDYRSAGDGNGQRASTPDVVGGEGDLVLLMKTDEADRQQDQDSRQDAEQVTTGQEQRTDGDDAGYADAGHGDDQAECANLSDGTQRARDDQGGGKLRQQGQRRPLSGRPGAPASREAEVQRGPRCGGSSYDHLTETWAYLRVDCEERSLRDGKDHHRASPAACHQLPARLMLVTRLTAHLPGRQIVAHIASQPDGSRNSAVSICLSIGGPRFRYGPGHVAAVRGGQTPVSSTPAQ